MMSKYSVICFSLILTATTLLSCDIPVEKTLLATFKRSDGSKVEIYFVAPGAVGEDVIQVRWDKPLEYGVGLKNFEHNFLDTASLLNDSTLFIIMKDSGPITSDTAIVNIK
jgi:hypothetical protein